jgi:hypothetical protein
MRQVLVGVVATATLAGAGWLEPHAVAAAPAELQHRASAASSPGEPVREYYRLDSEGGQLTEEGWRRIASLFVTPGSRPDLRSPSSSTVAVATRCVVDDVTVSNDGGTATVSVSNRGFGGLDLAAGRFTPVPGRIGVEGRGVFRLTKTTASWQIESPVPGPTLSVETAIRELEALRSRTADAEVKRNATQSLKVLRTLPREKR